MKIKKTTLFSLLLLAPLFSFGQKVKISGKVIDTNNQAIEFANVFIQCTSNSDIQKGVITNGDGEFELQLESNLEYKIAISFIGFNDWSEIFQLQLDRDFGKIKLTNASNKLGEILVTAERNMITRKEDKLVFNVAASPLKNGYDGLEILQRTPNVLVDPDGNITMRNESPNILINGRISNLTGEELANYLSNLRSENIKSIEVQTHLSANTDGESSGGVVNIVLNKNPIGFISNIRSDYMLMRNGYDAAFGGLNFNYGSENWNLYGLYNYTYRTNESRIRSTIEYFDRQERINSNEVFDSQLDRQSAKLGLVTNLAPNHILGIEARTNQFEFDHSNNGVLTVYSEGQEIENGSALVNGFSDGKLYSSTLNYSWELDTLNSKFKLFADVIDKKVNRPNTTISSYSNDILADNIERNNSVANTFTYSIQSDVEKYFKQNYKLDAGLKLTDTNRENSLASDKLINENWQPTGRTNIFNYKERVTAAYLSLSKNLSKSIFVKGGLRFENTDLEKQDLLDEMAIVQNYNNWFPNIYISKDLKNKRALSLSYSKRLRRPPFYFLSNNAVKINDFRYELGNPDLIPENVNNFELSIKDNKQNLNFYLQRTTEAINGIYFLEEQVAYYQKFNEGIQQQLGVSYNRFGNLKDWWYGKFLFSLYDRKFISREEDSFEQLTFQFNMTNNFKINPTSSIDLTARYRSTYADAYYISYQYYNLNLMFQKTFLDKKLICRIYINDILNSLESNSSRPFDNFEMTRNEKWSSQKIRFWISYTFNNKSEVNKRKNESKSDVLSRL